MRFDFLPDWRVDDLMMSFCTPEGGVGPHIDDYDVFIIQGKGSRRWQVGAIPHQARPGCKDLALIEDFEPILDVVRLACTCIFHTGYPHQRPNSFRQSFKLLAELSSTTYNVNWLRIGGNTSKTIKSANSVLSQKKKTTNSRHH